MSQNYFQTHTLKRLCNNTYVKLMPFPNISWQPFEERYFGEKILQQKPLIAPSRSCVGGESNGRHTLGPKGALVILGIVAEYSLHLSEYFFPLEYVSEREIKEQE